MSDRSHTLETDYFPNLLEGTGKQSSCQARAKYTLVPHDLDKNGTRYVRLDVQLETSSNGNTGHIPTQVIKIMKLRFNFDALQIPEAFREACVGILWNRPHEDAVEQVGKVCDRLLRFPGFQAWFEPLFRERIDVCVKDLLKRSDWGVTPWWRVKEWNVTPEAVAWMKENLPDVLDESECYYDCHESRDSMTNGSDDSLAKATTVDSSATGNVSTMVSTPSSVQSSQARTNETGGKPV